MANKHTLTTLTDQYKQVHHSLLYLCRKVSLSLGLFSVSGKKKKKNTVKAFLSVKKNLENIICICCIAGYTDCSPIRGPGARAGKHQSCSSALEHVLYSVPTVGRVVEISIRTLYCFEYLSYIPFSLDDGNTGMVV